MEQPEVDFTKLMLKLQLEPRSSSSLLYWKIKSLLIKLADDFGSIKITGVPPR